MRELRNYGIEGIVPSHGHILALLFNDGPQIMQDLAKKIRRTKPTVTVLVNKLVEHGYVVREQDATDSRVYYILLTTKGNEFSRIFQEISAKLKTKVYGAMTESEAGRLEYILGQIERRF